MSISEKTGWSLLRDVSWLGFAQVGAQLLTAFAAILVARTGGAYAFGTITVGLGIVAITSDVLDFGIGAYIGREYAAGRLSLAQALSSNHHRLLTFWLVALLGAATVAIIPVGIETSAVGLLLALYLVGAGYNLSQSILLRATQRFAIAAGCMLAERATVVLATAVFIYVKLDPALGFATGLALGAIVSSAIEATVLARIARALLSAVHNGRQARIAIREMYRRSWHLGVAGLSSDLNALEGPIVGAFAGIVSAGHYGAAMRFAGPLQIPSSALASALLPRLATQDSNLHVAIRRVRILTFFLLPLALIYVVVAVFSDEIVALAYGPSFGYDTAAALKIVCAIAFVSSVNQILFTICVSTRNDSIVRNAMIVGVPAGLALTAVGAASSGVILAATGGLMGNVLVLMILGSGLLARLASSPKEVDTE